MNTPFKMPAPEHIGPYAIHMFLADPDNKDIVNKMQKGMPQEVKDAIQQHIDIHNHVMDNMKQVALGNEPPNMMDNGKATGVVGIPVVHLPDPARRLNNGGPIPDVSNNQMA